MGALEKIIGAILPNNRLESAKPEMIFSLGDGDYFSDGSKYKRGIVRSGTPRIYHDTTRRINARNAYEESTAGRAIVRRHVDTVVDAGLKFKSKPLYDIIGISKEKAEKWADEFTQRFDLFMRSKMFASSFTMTGYQFPVTDLLFSTFLPSRLLPGAWAAFSPSLSVSPPPWPRWSAARKPRKRRSARRSARLSWDR